MKPAILKRLGEIVDLEVIRKANLQVCFDPMWGAARGYSDEFLRDAGVKVATVHDYRDVLFGGHAPEPDDHLLEDLREKMRATGAQIGIATDGDADRFGIVDADGTFLQPNYVIALLFDYLVESRGWKNGVAKSVATTNLINAIAKARGVELYETPVGFKYIGELIMQDKIAIGGEESAGLSIRHHVPEKDGVLAGLLCCEMVARRGKSLGEQLKALCNQVGSYYPQRENFRLTPEVKEKFTGKLRFDPQEFCGRGVSEVVRTDGLKLVFEDGSWVCYRLSGTEPVVRVYSEARSERGSGEVERGSQAMDFRVKEICKNPAISQRRRMDCARWPKERHRPRRWRRRGCRLSVRWDACLRLAATHCDDHGHGACVLAVRACDVWREWDDCLQTEADGVRIAAKADRAGAEGKRPLHPEDSGIEDRRKSDRERSARAVALFARPGSTCTSRHRRRILPPANHSAKK